MMRRLLIVLTACRRPGAVARPPLGGGGRIGAQETRGPQTERLTRTREHRRRGELELSNIAGDIVVTRGSGAAATIEVVKTARGAIGRGGARDAARSCRSTSPSAERAPKRARGIPPATSCRRSNRRNVNVSVAYTVAAPEGTRIIAKSISGNISVRDIIGRADARDRQRQRAHRQRRADGERPVDLRQHRARRHEGRGRARSGHRQRHGAAPQRERAEPRASTR